MNINEFLKGCELCERHTTRKNIVKGEGDINAEIFILGQSPGRSEDRTGRPFVGDAGRVLDELLKTANLKRSDVYITNLVKCFGNPKPKHNATRKCWRFWSQELDQVNPKIVVLLGAFVIEKVLGMKHFAISDIHGTMMKRDKQLFFLSFHPAAMLHNYHVKDALFEDFKHLGEFLGGIK